MDKFGLELLRLSAGGDPSSGPEAVVILAHWRILTGQSFVQVAIGFLLHYVVIFYEKVVFLLKLGFLDFSLFLKLKTSY